MTCIAVHPSGLIVASGQVGRKPPLCIWDAGGDQGGAPNDPKGEADSITHLGNLIFHRRGIVALDFSPDGALLVSVGADDGHSMAIWDWQNGIMLAQAR